MPAFERSEYLKRVRRTQGEMEKAGIDVLLVSLPDNMNYLSGYEGWSFYTHQMLVLAIDADEPIWVGRGIDVPCAELSAFMSDENLLGYSEDYVEPREGHAMGFVSDVLRERKLGSSRIGVEMEAFYYTARCHEELKARLPNARFSDATGLVNRLRLLKSPEEIRRMKQAGKIADRAMRAGLDAIEPGVRQCDAAAHIAFAQISGTKEAGGDVPLQFLIETGERGRAPHLTYTDQPFRPNETTGIELGGCRDRYHAGLSRTIHLGRPPPELSALADVVVDGMESALDSVRPGRTCEEIELTWRRSIEKAGFEKESRIGYSIGVGYPPCWLEYSASLRQGDQTELRPDMTFHMVLGMWLGSVNFLISETFRVSENGHEPLSNVPRRLFTK